MFDLFYPDDIFLWLIGIGIVLSIGSTVLWWVFVIWLAGMATRRAEKEFQQQMAFIQNLLKNAPQGKLNQLNPNQLAQFQQRMWQLQSQYNQMNELSRQRHEVFMGDLTGMAASAGIDFNPSSY